MNKRLFMGIIVFLGRIKALGEGYLKGSIEECGDMIFKIMMKHKKYI